MIIIIPFKTPTINHLYGFRGFHKFITKEAKEIKAKISEEVKEAMKNQYIWTGEVAPKLDVQIAIYENWLTKKGEVARKDISNREKFLMDSIFEALGIDDRFIFKHTMIKIQSEEVEKAVVTIEVLE
jgi:Holliday junction resolvase RusA-like endonuclease